MTPQHFVNEDEQMQTQRQSITFIVLFPLAFLQSHLYWVYSVLLCLCNRPSPNTPPDNLLNDPVTSIQTSSGRRLRALSEPPPMPYSHLVDPSSLRPRSTTIHTTELPKHQTGSDATFRTRPTVTDELYGITCPPLWWQKTRRILALRPSSPSSPVSPLEAERDPEARKARSSLLLRTMFHKETAQYNKPGRVSTTLAKLQHIRPRADEDDRNSLSNFSSTSTSTTHSLSRVASLKKRGLWKRLKTSSTPPR